MAAGLLAGAACGALHAAVASPEYMARGHVMVRAEEGTDPAAAVGLAQLYGRLADDPAVLREAGRLPGEVRASTSPDAPVIEITGTAGEPRAAAAVANAVAPALVAYGNGRASPSGGELAVLSPALPPSGPSSPSAPAAVAVGACTGAVVGGLVLLAGGYRREAVAATRRARARARARGRIPAPLRGGAAPAGTPGGAAARRPAGSRARRRALAQARERSRARSRARTRRWSASVGRRSAEAPGGTAAAVPRRGVNRAGW